MRAVFMAIVGATLLAAQDTTASLRGEALDRGDRVIQGVDAELRLEDPPQTRFSVRTDDDGKFKFTLLPAGTYTLTLTERRFRTLTLKSIRVANGEQQILPPLRVDVSGSCGTGGPVLKDLEQLPAEQQVGSLSGRVKRDETHPIARATVKLLCDDRKICGETKTDSNGEFIFFNLPPRDEVTIRVTHPGFYSWEGKGYEVRAEFHSIYGPIILDSSLRPRPPVAVCE
jgi:Carboxypeptidase regulatory-like domain